MTTAVVETENITPMTTPDPYIELETILMTMSRGLVDKPDEVTIFPAKGEGFVHFEVRCDDRDLGALIGKRGAHATSMRSILSASAAVRNIRVTVQFISREGDGHAGR